VAFEHYDTDAQCEDYGTGDSGDYDVGLIV
jgi:hypothetical protein